MDEYANLIEQLGINDLKPGEKVRILIAGGGAGLTPKTVFPTLSPEILDKIIIVHEAEGEPPRTMEDLLSELPERSLGFKITPPPLFSLPYSNQLAQYQKHRKLTNKKYVKRKKAKNGRTKKRKK